MSENDDMQYHDETEYKRSAPITVEEALNKDKEDESLARWKASLLSANVPTNAKNVVFSDIIFKINTEQRKIPIAKAEQSLASKTPLFVVYEKSVFSIGFAYSIYNKIVSGLHAVFKVSKMGISLAKQNVMLGCYAPRAEEYQYFMEEIDAPSGPMGRGLYYVKCVFGDDDCKTGTHGTIEFYFKIDKGAEAK